MGKRKKSKSSPENKEGVQSKRQTMPLNQNSPNNGTAISAQCMGQNYMIPGNLTYNNIGNNSNVGQTPPPVMGQNGGQLPCTPLSQQSQVNIDPFSLILQRLDRVDSRLSQLDTIQSSVNTIIGRLNDIDQKVIMFDRRLTELENSRQFDAANMDDIRKQQSCISELTKRLKQIESEKSYSEELVSKLKCDELKNNLLFFKVKDSEVETPKTCKETILEIMQDKMEITNAKEYIQLDSVERLGKFKAEKTRPVLVKFNKFEQRESVRKACPKLKGTTIGVSPHYPKDIADKRKALSNVFKEARKSGKKAYFKYDKLYIDEKEYIPPTRDSQGH